MNKPKKITNKHIAAKLQKAMDAITDVMEYGKATPEALKHIDRNLLSKTYEHCGSVHWELTN